MGPIWRRQDPGGPHVGPMNFDIWVGHDDWGPLTYHRLTLIPTWISNHLSGKWNYSFIHKPQQLHHWSLWMDKLFRLTLYNGRNDLLMVMMTGCIDVILSFVSGKSTDRHNLSMISIASIDVVYYLLYFSRVLIIDVHGMLRLNWYPLNNGWKLHNIISWTFISAVLHVN